MCAMKFLPPDFSIRGGNLKSSLLELERLHSILAVIIAKNNTKHNGYDFIILPCCGASCLEGS